MKMGNFLKNVQRGLAENRRGIAAVMTAVAATAVLATASSGAAIVLPVPANIPNPFGGPGIPLVGDSSNVHLSTSMSQSKVVEGSDGTVSIEVNIDSPKIGAAIDRKPTDFLVVLDRSGSMSADNRLPYAKSAINELLSRLQEGDRLGLITFDSSVETAIPLSRVSDSFKNSARQLIDRISVGGSTNIGDALQEAQRQLPAFEGGRIRKVLLLSDGEANVGTVDPQALGTIAHGLAEHSAVLSTIGMGLGFNERTMSLLADRGMGNYGYLENLEKLGVILARDLDATRAIFAEASRLDLILPDGARLTDAGGYPFAAIAGVANGYRIETGQLAGAARKNLFVTVQLPTSAPAELAFAPARLNYDVNGQTRIAVAEGPAIAAAVVPRERSAEAAASIREDVYRRNWALNNFGMMKSQVAGYLSAGRRDEAEKAIADYRGKVAKAEEKGNLQILNAPMQQELDLMQADAKDAFSGSAAEQGFKQNRYGKKLHAEGRAAQRGEFGK